MILTFYPSCDFLYFNRLRIAEGERKAVRQEREYMKKHQIEELKKLQRERDEMAKNYELAVSRVSFLLKIKRFRNLKQIIEEF